MSLAFLLAANVNNKSCALGEELKLIVFGGMLMLDLVLNITGLMTHWSVDTLPLIKCAALMMTQTETAFSMETMIQRNFTINKVDGGIYLILLNHYFPI